MQPMISLAQLGRSSNILLLRGLSFEIIELYFDRLFSRLRFHTLLAVIHELIECRDLLGVVDDSAFDDRGKIDGFAFHLF